MRSQLGEFQVCGFGELQHKNANKCLCTELGITRSPSVKTDCQNCSFLDSEELSELLSGSCKPATWRRCSGYEIESICMHFFFCMQPNFFQFRCGDAGDNCAVFPTFTVIITLNLLSVSCNNVIQVFFKWWGQKMHPKIDLVGREVRCDKTL